MLVFWMFHNSQTLKWAYPRIQLQQTISNSFILSIYLPKNYWPYGWDMKCKHIMAFNSVTCLTIVKLTGVDLLLLLIWAFWVKSSQLKGIPSNWIPYSTAWVLGTVAGGGEGISSFPTGYSRSLCIGKGHFCSEVLLIRAENSQFRAQNDFYLRPLAKMWYHLICCCTESRDGWATVSSQQSKRLTSSSLGIL